MRVIRLTSLADDMDEVLRPLEPEYVHHLSARTYHLPPLPQPRRKRLRQPQALTCPCGCGLKLGGHG